MEELWKVDSSFAPDRSCCYTPNRILSQFHSLERDGPNVMKVAETGLFCSTETNLRTQSLADVRCVTAAISSGRPPGHSLLAMDRRHSQSP